MKPIPLTDWIELSFYWLALGGLLIAWRWEGLGGAIATVAPICHYFAFRIIRGYWFPGIVLPGLLFVVPGILFIMCWALARESTERNTVIPKVDWQVNL